MGSTQEPRRGQFWRLVGIASAIAVSLSLLYTLVTPSNTAERLASTTLLSDALCTSALLLGLCSGIPFLVDAGRGLMLPGKIQPGTTSRQKVWDSERAKREKGMRITFALGLAAVLVGVLSLLASIW